jgi:transposase-like protein
MGTRKVKPTATNKDKEKNTTQTPDVSEVDETSLAISQLPNPKMQRAIHLYMTGQYSYNKIAQLLEVHPNTIINWFKRKDVQLCITEMQDVTHQMVATQLKTLTLQATDKLRELMNSPIDGVALQAVKDVLDRAGHKQKQEIKIDKTITTVEEKWKSLIDSTIVEGEFEEVEE